MLPPSPPHNITQTYTHLLSLLHPTPPAVLELDILPPSPQTNQILHEKTSIAIPFPLLLQCHLHALSVLFSRPLPPPPSPTAPTATASNISHLNHEEEKYMATSILLLQEPTHLTAANVRKTYLLALRTLPHPTSLNRPPTHHNPQLTAAVDNELLYLTSLLTSPLYKHAKSPVLWSHRLWLLQTFPYHIHKNATSGWVFVDKELDIVMAAGERHARNYYAWNYGRDVVRLASTSRNGGGGGQPGGEEAEEEEEEENGWQDCVTKVHKWCLAHPRDISGWSFLAFLLNTHPSPPSTTSQRLTGEGKEAETMGVMREWNRKEATIREIIARTQDFVEKYGWKGESIEWFLGSIT